MVETPFRYLGPNASGFQQGNHPLANLFATFIWKLLRVIMSWKAVETVLISVTSLL
jgi:hypothetical protein